MTTLITGAGMVGSLVAAELVARGEQKPVLFDIALSMPNLEDRLDLGSVDLVQGDIIELSELIAVIKKYGVDRIIHTAGMLSSSVLARAAAGVRVNMMGTLAVLEATRLCDIERLVFTSSGSAVLGKSYPAGEAVIEDVRLAAVSEHPPAVYATVKLACEWLCHNYRDEFGLSTVAVRPVGVFGPWFGAPSGQPARIMRAVVEGGWRNGVVRMSPTDIGLSMDFVYASDVALGLVLACQHPDPPNAVYHISMGKLHSVDDAVRILSELLGREIGLESTNEAAAAMSYAQAPLFDISKAERDLGYAPRFPMEKAIEDYVAWMERHHAPAVARRGG